MPTTYTHYYFGEECVHVLPAQLKRIVDENREIFDIGVHGPDIFFYYHFFLKNRVHQYGSKLHFKPAKAFFKKCKKAYLKADPDDQDALFAYILGFLSHFALDSTCHGYVDRKWEVDGPSHNLIESQYDAYLFRKKGLTPIKVNRQHVIKPRAKHARIIAMVHPFHRSIVLSSLRQQSFVLWGLYSPFNVKKTIVRIGLKLLHMNPELGDLYMDNQELDSCKDSNLRLDKLRALALKRYPELVVNWLDLVFEDKPLPDYFMHDFEPWPDYKEIPILPLKEELEYHVSS